MTASTSTEIPIDRDAQGFLLHAEQWSEQIAERLARENGITELTDRHWQVINAMRRNLVERGTSPWLPMLTKVSGVPIEELFRLFPRAPSRLVAKIAGIPKLRACI
jgi:tRNA 2-thiouridine synthesizing protein E